MGIEILLGASLVLGAATAITQNRAANEAADAQKEANEISAAQQRNKNMLERRRAAKEARIKRAKIIQGAESGGAGSSSGSLGAQSALASNFGSSVAGQTADVLASEGITKQGERAATAIRKADNFAAWAKVGQKGISTFQTIWEE